MVGLEIDKSDIDRTKSEVIGRGGFGYVEKCLYRSEEVAVKKCKIDSNTALYENLRREANILSKLDHPNIVKFIGIIGDVDEFSFVLQYCRNGNCFDFFSGTSDRADLLPLKFDSAKQICLGMIYLHSKNILHLDLKAQNVLLDDFYKIKICDFGLSKIKETYTSLLPPETNSAAGTISHIPPEKFENSTCPDMPYMDVYSYGVLLLEIITGTTPFEGLDRQIIIDLVCKYQHPKIKSELIPEFFYNIMKDTWKVANVRPSFKEILETLKSCKNYVGGNGNLLQLYENHKQNSFALNDLSARSESIDRNDLLTLDSSPNSTTYLKNGYEKPFCAKGKIDNSKQITEEVSGFSDTEPKRRLSQGAVRERVLSTIKDGNETGDSTKSSISLCISSSMMSQPNKTTPSSISSYSDESAKHSDRSPLIDGDIDEPCPVIPRQTATNKCKLFVIIFVSTIAFTGIILLFLFLTGIIGIGTCSKLSYPANSGTMKCSRAFHIGSHCKFSCLEGYILKSRGSIADNTTTCGRNKKWSEPTPYCEKEILCPPLVTSAISTCSSKDKVSNGSICIFSCHSGYVLSGDEVLSCSQDGKWNGTAPNCQEGCSDPAHDLHMNMTCTKGRLLNSKCTFSCAQNFTFVGNPNMACIKNKEMPEWTDPVPKCYCPACRTGPNCEYNIQWSEVVKSLNKSSCEVANVFYYGKHPITCGLTSAKSTTCRCTNKENNIMQDCPMKSEEKLLDTCERALSSLILSLVAKDPNAYELPCDSWTMPLNCKYFKKKQGK